MATFRIPLLVSKVGWSSNNGDKNGYNYPNFQRLNFLRIEKNIYFHCTTRNNFFHFWKKSTKYYSIFQEKFLFKTCFWVNKIWKTSCPCEMDFDGFPIQIITASQKETVTTTKKFCRSTKILSKFMFNYTVGQYFSSQPGNHFAGVWVRNSLYVKITNRYQQRKAKCRFDCISEGSG